LVGIVVPIVLAVIGWILYPSSSHRNSLINIGGNIGIQTQGQVGNNTTNNNFISPHHFSETQSIKILPPSLGGIDTLNLDNIATLKAWFNTHFGITLLLDTPAIAFPPKIGIEGAEVWQRDGKQYVFDLVNNQEQEVIVSGRTFII